MKDVEKARRIIEFVLFVLVVMAGVGLGTWFGVSSALMRHGIN